MKKSKLLALILAGCIAVSSLTACGAASGTKRGRQRSGERLCLCSGWRQSSEDHGNRGLGSLH